VAENTISISVEHNMRAFQTRIGITFPRLVRGALNDATTEGTRMTGRFFIDEMIRRAGGKYWDVNAEITGGITGTRGVVSVPASKPHRINPKKRGGSLFINGRWFRGGVNHPGSRPIDLIGPLRRRGLAPIHGAYKTELDRALGTGASTALPTSGL
jgi:hypothetical protein